MGNITQVHFKEGQESVYGITGLKQWDKGQKLEISGLHIDKDVEVHFSLSQYDGVAKRMLGKMVDGILHTDIPAFIMEGPEYCAGARTYSAYAWGYVSNEESAETIRKMEFVIEARAKPEEYVSPEDMGFLERLEAEMKNKLDKSGHAPNKILGTDAEGNVIAKDNEPEVDLSEYVKNTDYASSEKAGVVKVISNQGIEMDKEVISISPANCQTIDTKASYRMPIVPAFLDYAVMKALSDSKYAWTEEEKLNSRKLLGVTGEDQLLRFAIKPTTEKDTFLSIQDSADYKVLDFGMDGKTEQDTIPGNQLFDISKMKSDTQCTNNGDGTLTLKDYAPSTRTNCISECCPNVKVGMTIKFSSQGSVMMYFGGVVVSANNYFTVTQEVLNKNSFGFYGALDSTPSNPTIVSNIMINEGTVALPYEPYTGNQPSPNPEYPQEIVNAGVLNEETGRYEIGIWVYTTNHFNIERALDVNEYIKLDTSVINVAGEEYAVPIVLKPNTDYAAIAERNNNTSNLRVYTTKSTASLLNDNRVVTTGEDGMIYIGFLHSVPENQVKIFSNGTYTNIHIVEGRDKTAPYQEFGEQRFVLTSPVPLTKWDKLVKRDGVYGWSIYGIKLVIDGTYNWYRYSSYNGFALGADILTNVMWRREGYCNQMPVYRGADNVSTIGLLLGVGNKKIYNLYNPMYDETLEDYGASNWKAHVAENPLEIWTYADEEQAFYPLSDSEQTLLKNLETYYGVTNVFNDQGCPMWLTYVADTKLYIDNKILSIQTAMI